LRECMPSRSLRPQMGVESDAEVPLAQSLTP
jgi:hypothetical protein